MGKILYIEDQLTIDIQKIFAPVLKDKRTIKLLDQLEKDDYQTAALIIEACSYTSCLDICHTYVNALSKILTCHKDYELIIIDRNLSEYSYHEDLDDIKQYLLQSGFDNPEEKIDQYISREGDLLLLILLKLNKDYKDKIYYLTANMDELRGSPELGTLMDVGSFSQTHILEKSSAQEEILCDIIKDIDSFTIQNKYSNQCRILRKQLSNNEDTINQFIELVKLSEVLEKKIDFLLKLRPLIEKLLNTLAVKVNEANAIYWDIYHGKPRLKEKDFINCLDDINNRFDISYNKNIRQCLYSLWQIPSDFAQHNTGNPNDITRYTVAALLNQLCDVILWYDKAMDSLS